MATKKALVERLKEIKDESSRLAAATDQIDSPELNDAAGLAEEAAGLGLELADLLTAKEKK